MNAAALARWVSVWVFPLIGWKADADGGGVGWAMLAFFILTGLPMLYILVGMRTKGG